MSVTTNRCRVRPTVVSLLEKEVNTIRKIRMAKTRSGWTTAIMDKTARKICRANHPSITAEDRAQQVSSARWMIHSVQTF